MASSRTPVILVVEDEALVREFAADLFEEEGFEVVQAPDGSEAIKMLKLRPDIWAVMTDIHMPGRADGIDLTRHVREVCPDCAVVVVSGRGLASWPTDFDERGEAIPDRRCRGRNARDARLIASSGEFTG